MPLAMHEWSVKLQGLLWKRIFHFLAFVGVRCCPGRACEQVFLFTEDRFFSPETAGFAVKPATNPPFFRAFAVRFSSLAVKDFQGGDGVELNFF